MTEHNTQKPQEVFIKMVLDAWRSKVSQFDMLLSELSDEQLGKEVAPGRNRGTYLLGHLTSLADSIFPLLGYEKSAPHLWKPFVQLPDRVDDDVPGAKALRQEWIKVRGALEERITTIGTEEWFRKHTAISAEDFEKEPHRNKLNVILSRVSHLDYHLGQLQFLKNR